MPYGRGNDRHRVCSVCGGELDGAHTSYCRKCYAEYQKAYKAGKRRYRTQIVIDDNTDWQQHAACKKHTSMMFPFTELSQKSVAEFMCQKRCGVVDQCLKYALDNEIEYGVFGGKTENERRKMLNKRIRGDRRDKSPFRFSEPPISTESKTIYVS